MDKSVDAFAKNTQKKLQFANEVFSWMIKNTKVMQQYEEFDFPDYGGMPKRLSQKLSSWTVDNIQENWHLIKKNKSMLFLVENILLPGW